VALGMFLKGVGIDPIDACSTLPGMYFGVLSYSRSGMLIACYFLFKRQ
jgi:hypothetical protein